MRYPDPGHRMFHVEFGEWTGIPAIGPITWEQCCEYLGDSPGGMLSQRLLSEGAVTQVRLAKGYVATQSGVCEIVDFDPFEAEKHV